MANWSNLAEMFLAQAERLGDNPFLWGKIGTEYVPTSWSRAADQIGRISSYLSEKGIGHGDRVVLCSENRPEWPIAHLAIMSLGAITVPAYTTNTINSHRHIFSDSGAKAAIVSTAQLAENLLPAAIGVGGVDFVLAMEPPAEPAQGLEVVSWPDVLNGEAPEENWLWSKIQERDGAETAVIIYTSGTGGLPKGVMLDHRAILHNCRGATDALLEIGLDDEVFLSFLPLSHSYEYTGGQFFPIYIGAQIYYAEGIEHLSRNMAEAKPTIMTAVPRLYEVMHGRIVKGVEKAGGLKAKLFHAAVRLGQQEIENPGSLSAGQRLQNGLVEKLVRSKVRNNFGGRLKALVSGGAPLNYDIGVFFSALGLRILQGYGQTESAPVISVNRPSLIKLKTVGPALINTEVKIADDGEILVRGELVMQGYWRNEDATREAIVDGWLHTGDIGRLDEDGYIEITDRKKDIIVNSGGDTLSPQRVEGFLTLRPEISQAMVHGDKRPHLVVAIVPDEEFLKEWNDGRNSNLTMTEAVTDEQFKKEIGNAIETVNGELALNERVRRFILLANAFTVDNEMLTPTLKVRRHKVMEAHGTEIEGLY